MPNISHTRYHLKQPAHYNAIVSSRHRHRTIVCMVHRLRNNSSGLVVSSDMGGRSRLVNEGLGKGNTVTYLKTLFRQ